MPTYNQSELEDSAPVKEHTVAELQELYDNGLRADKEIFAEMKSNILLVAGEHYNKKRLATWQRIRTSRGVAEQQKLRLTKNHIYRVANAYTENLLSMSPDVLFSPTQDVETQDRKAAEQHQSVWETAKEKYSYEELREEWGSDAIELGETHVGIFYDTSVGPVIGYEPVMGEDGQEQMDMQTGAPVEDKSKPMRMGEFVFEEIHAFDLIRDANSRNIKKSPWLCHQKMVDVDVLQEMFPEYADKIKGSVDSTMVVFDAESSSYRLAGDQCLVKEFYFRPSLRYAKGYFYILIGENEVDKGLLPAGVFPIVSQVYWRIKTSARGRSMVIKTARPYQAEINRTASKIAEHQITLGDDKVFTSSGSSVQAGLTLPGIRQFSYTGAEPHFVEGRTGAQYLDYLNHQIDEMYMALDLDDVKQDKEGDAAIDPMLLLFKQASKRKKMGRLVRKFESFNVEVAKTFTLLAKHHLPDAAFVEMAGRNEAVNVEEYRNTDPLCYRVKTEPRTDDIESRFGKQMVLQHLVQYYGAQLDKEDVGLIVQEMEFGNVGHVFKKYTQKFKLVDNVKLALDRGEVAPLGPFDDNEFIANELANRVREPDFATLAPEIQRNYAITIQMHEEAASDKLVRVKQLEQQFIPIDGPLVKVDYYVESAEGGKPERAMAPLSSLIWLLNALETQGTAVEKLKATNSKIQGDVGGILAAKTEPLPVNQPGIAQ